MTHTFCSFVQAMLLDPQLANQKIVYYVGNLRGLSNASYLLGAFLCLHLNATPAEAWMPFSSLSPSVCLPYRDGKLFLLFPKPTHTQASWYAMFASAASHQGVGSAATWVMPNPYPLPIQECWAGLVRAVKEGLYHPERFDKVSKMASNFSSVVCLGLCMSVSLHGLVSH